MGFTTRGALPFAGAVYACMEMGLATINIPNNSQRFPTRAYFDPAAGSLKGTATRVFTGGSQRRVFAFFFKCVYISCYGRSAVGTDDRCGRYNGNLLWYPRKIRTMATTIITNEAAVAPAAPGTAPNERIDNQLASANICQTFSIDSRGESWHPTIPVAIAPTGAEMTLGCAPNTTTMNTSSGSPRVWAQPKYARGAGTTLIFDTLQCATLA